MYISPLLSLLLSIYFYKNIRKEYKVIHLTQVYYSHIHTYYMYTINRMGAVRIDENKAYYKVYIYLFVFDYLIGKEYKKQHFIFTRLATLKVL